VSDPELRKKLFGQKWIHYEHESEKQGWPWWKRLIHRLQSCPVCHAKKWKKQDNSGISQN
jgi:hypothetical protein